MNVMKAIITVGIPASGKSTWAKEWQLEDEDNRWVIELDEIRKRYSHENKLTNYHFKNERKVVEEFYKDIAFAASCEKDICLSNTNVNGKHLDKLVDYLTDLGYLIDYKVFHTTVRNAVRHDKKRDERVGLEVIHRMNCNYNQLRQTHPHIFAKENIECPIVAKVKPMDNYTYTDRPKVAVVDIDGTLALMHNRSAYDYPKAIDDHVREDVALLVNALSEKYYIVFLSGRSEDCRDVTEEWLKKAYNDGYLSFDPQSQPLLMRESGDTRQDWVIKYEIYRDIISNFGELSVVVDDRPQVLRMWDMLDVPTVFNVGRIHHEF